MFFFGCIITEKESLSIERNSIPFWEPCDSIIFDLEQYTPSDVSYIEEVFVDDVWYFILLNTPNNSLDIYNDHGVFNRRIEIPREGLGSILSITSFHFVNKDSIFVFPKGEIYNALLLNWEGDVVDYSLFKIPETGSLFNHLSIQSSKIIKDGNKLYFIHTPLGLAYKKGFFSHEYYSEYCFDLKNKTFEPVLHTGWPDEYKKELQNKIVLVPNRTRTHDGKRLLSFANLDSVIIYDDEKIIKREYFSRPFINKKPRYGVRQNEDYANLMESYFYYTLVTGYPGSGKYYRFFKFPYFGYSTSYKEYERQHIFLSEMGVLVTDVDFNDVQVKRLPALKYNHTPFAGRNGLYVTANPYYINQDEEYEIVLYIFQ
ncbi:MAG TPA: DUF4221 family protein [Saprospiraceae bacterium]|nr:DUF4221 family protein [Saprospiraceae bacterium]